MKNILDWAMNRGEKPERLTANMLKNANNILEPIAIDPKAQLQVSNNQGDTYTSTRRQCTCRIGTKQY